MRGLLGFQRCMGAIEATKLLWEADVGTCRPHINGFTLAKNIYKMNISGWLWRMIIIDLYKSATNVKYIDIWFEFPPMKLMLWLHLGHL